ncbi:hypothetical protein PoB_000759900 [Plakobranchus ocellatus]|uniref:Uncharacterized protein n=1 Tax=Plakobranchus ocellatus TaxID=259542 RepID=A0AAV3YFL7_9GAST|nr:hypothetical protein PoB_000759900 [Plakobranchus ocellatus]
MDGKGEANKSRTLEVKSVITNPRCVAPGVSHPDPGDTIGCFSWKTAEEIFGKTNPLKVYSVTTAIPPTSHFRPGAVSSETLVVVIIKCAELFPIVIRERVASISTVGADSKNKSVLI